MSAAYCEQCGTRSELSFEELLEGNADCGECGGVLILVADEEEDDSAELLLELGEGEGPVEESEELRQALSDQVVAHLGKTLRPKAVRFVDALPKTATGKIQRFKLREDA